MNKINLSQQTNFLSLLLGIVILLVIITGIIRKKPFSNIFSYSIFLIIPIAITIFDINCLSQLYNFINGKNIINSTGSLCNTWSWIRTIFTAFFLIILILAILSGSGADTKQIEKQQKSEKGLSPS